MIRVLHILGSLERAGIETFVMNLYRNIDRNAIQFDFAIYNEPTISGYAEEVKSLGGRIFVIPKKEKNIVKCFSTIRNIVKDNSYCVVWRHTSSCIGGMDLYAAYFGGAKTRVLHSHSARRFGLERGLHYLLRPLCQIISTKKIACGRLAGRWMFGRTKYEIIPNGINTGKFSFDFNIREDYRAQFGINNEVVIGNVGRFEKVKNHSFMIDVFNEYSKSIGNAILMLVGDGSLEEDCRKKVKALGITNKVLFLGNRSDISNLLQMMDVYFMPSKYEGFPVSLLEAQTTGLPCVVSSAVSRETNITANVTYVSLSEPYTSWCNALREASKKRDANGCKKVCEAGYDISDVALQVEKMLGIT